MNTYPLNLNLRKTDIETNLLEFFSCTVITPGIIALSIVPFTLGDSLLGIGLVSLAPIVVASAIISRYTPKKKKLKQELLKEYQKLQAHMKANYQLELSILQAKRLFHGYDVTVTRDDSTEITLNLSYKGVFVVKGETSKLLLNPEQNTLKAQAMQEKILPTKYFAS